MTEKIIGQRTPEVNSDSRPFNSGGPQNVLPIKTSNRRNQSYSSGILGTVSDICHRLGLQYKSKDRAWLPLSGGGRGYANGLHVIIRDDGTFVLESDGTEHRHQPSDEEKDQIADQYEALVADRTPIPVVCLKRDPFPIKEDDPLPKNVSKRKLYFYHPPSEGGKAMLDGKERLAYELATMVVVREDFTEEYIREHNLEGGNRKRCVAWVPYDDGGMAIWRPSIPASDSGWKTPLYMRHWSGNPGHWYMVHEGEKAVDAAVEYSMPGSGHELQSVLAQYTHVTWQGGALRSSVSRADWDIVNHPGAEIVLGSVEIQDSRGLRF